MPDSKVTQLYSGFAGPPSEGTGAPVVIERHFGVDHPEAMAKWLAEQQPLPGEPAGKRRWHTMTPDQRTEQLRRLAEGRQRFWAAVTPAEKANLARRRRATLRANRTKMQTKSATGDGAAKGEPMGEYAMNITKEVAHARAVKGAATRMANSTAAERSKASQKAGLARWKGKSATERLIHTRAMQAKRWGRQGQAKTEGGRLVSVIQAAAILGVSPSTINNFIKAGTLRGLGKAPGKQRAKRFMIPLAAVLKRLENGVRRAAAPSTIGIVIDVRRGARIIRRSRPILVPAGTKFGATQKEAVAFMRRVIKEAK